MSDNPQDYELTHFGVKGMKWGIRRSRDELAKGKPKPEVSDDASKARASQAKAQKKGIGSLTNDELRQLNDRMNLEQNYSRMAPAKVSRGKQILEGASSAVGAAKTVSDSLNVLNKAIPALDNKYVKMGQSIINGLDTGLDIAKKFTK